MENLSNLMNNPDLHIPIIAQPIDIPMPLLANGSELSRDAQPRESHLSIVILDDRILMRDCLGSGLLAADPSMEIEYFSDVSALEAGSDTAMQNWQVVLFCVEWTKSRSEQYFAQIVRLKAREPSLNIVVISDIEDWNDVLKVMEIGARGVIPSEVTLEVAVKAMELVASGGIYVPPSVLSWPARVMKEAAQQPPPQSQIESMFTSRQLSVVEALRRGKANKVIAYELNMCESTVKVHIHNIMKKLKATNRTEVAYILNDGMRRDASPLRN